MLLLHGHAKALLITRGRRFWILKGLYGRVVESEDFLGFRLHPINCSSSKNRLRLPHPFKTDSDSSTFENPTPTPAENMRCEWPRYAPLTLLLPEFFFFIYSSTIRLADIVYRLIDATLIGNSFDYPLF